MRHERNHRIPSVVVTALTGRKNRTILKPQTNARDPLRFSRPSGALRDLIGNRGFSSLRSVHPRLPYRVPPGRFHGTERFLHEHDALLDLRQEELAEDAAALRKALCR